MRALQIEGHSFDLEDLLMCFPAGDDERLQVIKTMHRGKEIYLLLADKFADVSSGRAAYDIGIIIVRKLNGILFLSNASAQPLQAGGTFKWADESWKPEAQYISMVSLASRSRLGVHGATIVDANGNPRPEPPPRRSRQRHWLDWAATSTRGTDLLHFLEGPRPDWYDLYKAGEILHDLAGHESWWPKGFSDFKGSAQFARHAFGPHERMPPGKRMSLEAARELIRGLAVKCLNEKSGYAP